MASVVRAFLGAVLLALLATSGCTHPCLALAEKLCACESGDLEQERCEERMKSAFDATRESDLKASAETCSELIDQCDCRYVATEEGRQACGLAREG